MVKDSEGQFPRDDDYTVSMDLTHGEAKFLAQAMSRIGGDRETSRRKYADEIARFLKEEYGYEWDHDSNINGNIYFNT